MIEHFAEYERDTGRVTQCLTLEHPIEGNPFDPQFDYAPLAAHIDWSAQPSPTCELRCAEGAARWIETDALTAAQAQAWETAKTARDVAEASDFKFEGVLYQPDVNRITGAVLNALMAQLAGVPFSIDWTVSDNSVVTLDGAQMQALGLALARRIASIHETGRAMRQAIADAATPEAAYAAAVWPAPTEDPNV